MGSKPRFSQLLIHCLHPDSLLRGASMSVLPSGLLCFLLLLTENKGNGRGGGKLPFARSINRLKKNGFTPIPLCSRQTSTQRLEQRAAASRRRGSRPRTGAALRRGAALRAESREERGGRGLHPPACRARRAGPAYCGAATKPGGRGGLRCRSCSPAAAPGREASGDALPALSGTERLPASPGPAPPLPARRQRGVCGTGTCPGPCPAEERCAARHRRDGGPRRVQHQSDVPLPAPQRGGDPPRRQIHPQIQGRGDGGHRGESSPASSPGVRAAEGAMAVMSCGLRARSHRPRAVLRQRRGESLRGRRGADKGGAGRRGPRGARGWRRGVAIASLPRFQRWAQQPSSCPPTSPSVPQPHGSGMPPGAVPPPPPFAARPLCGEGTVPDVPPAAGPAPSGLGVRALWAALGGDA